jgi:hypothetical protein
MDSTTNADIDAEQFGDFLGDEETFQFFTDSLNAPLSELDQFERVVADFSDPWSEGQRVTTETRAAENQLQNDEPAEAVSIGELDNADEVISSASHILPRPISSNDDWRKDIERLIFGETIHTPRNSAVYSEDDIDGPTARTRITEILPDETSQVQVQFRTLSVISDAPGSRSETRRKPSWS